MSFSNDFDTCNLIFFMLEFLINEINMEKRNYLNIHHMYENLI